MKTRGKTKVQNPDYSKDGSEARETMDDGNETNGYSEDKSNEPVQARGDNRNGGARRPGARNARAGGPRAKADKHIMESAEFREVVQGFFDFIEEINKRRKKKPNKPKPTNDPKTFKPIDEPESRKMVKRNPEFSQNQLNEKSDQPLTASPIDPSKVDRNGLYRHQLPQQLSNPTRFNEEVSASKELLELMKRDEKEPLNLPSNNFLTAQNQEQKSQFRPKENEAARQKEPQVNKPSYAAGMPADFNSFDPNLKFLQGSNLQDFSNQMLLKQQANKLANTNFYENTNVFKDIMQKIQMQSFNEQNPLRNYYLPPPFDNYPKLGLEGFGVKPNTDLMNFQVIEALLQKNQNNLLGSLLGTPQTAAALFSDLTRELPYMLPNVNQNQNQTQNQNQQRFGNQSLGVELIQSDPEVINPKTFEGKLGRAATHVAIAYFIYFKSLDPDTIAKSDKSKMDPTYNARMLKEKKYENFGNESSMVNKLLPAGFEGRLANLGLGSGFSLDSFGAQDLQRLLAQQGISEQLREAQLQRLQQEVLLRNEELSNAQGRSGYQAKNEIKVEDKDEIQRRRANKQNIPKEEEIIEIKENSDTEMDEEKNNKPASTSEIKEEKIEPSEKGSQLAEVRSQPAINEQAIRPETHRSKSEENNGTNLNVEDIVEEITELTNPNNSDQEKGKKKVKPNRKIPGKKPDEQPKAPNINLLTQKPFAVNEESEASVQTHNNRPETKAPEKQEVQFISSDEGQTKMQDESAEKKPEPANTEPDQQKAVVVKPQE